MKALEYLMSVTRNPWNSLTIPTVSKPETKFTPEEDRFLMCAMFRWGYGYWDKIKQEIALEPTLKNDFFHE